MKSFESIYQDIKDRFEKYTGQSITDNTVMDLYTMAVSDVHESVYKSIEDMKNPYLYSKLRGQNLDDLGFMLNMPREEFESDRQYLYRLMNWKLSAEASNTVAINNAMLNLENASYAEYIPLTLGSGTATVYIIPVDYEPDTIIKAKTEAELTIKNVVSPSIYVEYVVPKSTPVVITLNFNTEGDKETIKRSLFEKIKSIINDIPPNGYLKLGDIIKVGINEEAVTYFSIMEITIDKKVQDETEIFQPIEYKFLLDEIIWIEE